PGPSHETAQIASEAVGRLNRAMDRLPAHLKQALVLTALQGLSQKEAGEVLGVGAKVVEMRAYRARKLLAEALERSDAGDIGRIG
ncbi:MAG: RNA polymerase sigma factor, partial [Caulobacteraceae bacterium]